MRGSLCKEYMPMSRTSTMSQHQTSSAKAEALRLAAAFAIALSLAFTLPALAFALPALASADEGSLPISGEQPAEAAENPSGEYTESQGEPAAGAGGEAEEGAGGEAEGVDPEGETAQDPEPQPEPEKPAPLKPGWSKDADGTWHYGLSDGTAKTGWIKLKGVWYWLEPANGGAMVTGLYTVNGKDYHFKASGAMSIGWVNHEGIWYYASTSGALQKGWIDLKGKRYWLDPANGGAMATGRTTIGGEDYLFAASGALAKNCWCKLADTWYYAGASGELKTGWIKPKSAWYWLDPANGGAMVTGVHTIAGKTYHFNASGAMSASKWVEHDGAWHYATSKGHFQTGWLNLNGKTYWLDPANGGAVATGFFFVEESEYFANENGSIAKATWVKRDGALLLATTDGRLVQEATYTSGGGIKLVGGEYEGATGLINLEGSLLHVDPASEEGALSTGWIEIEESKLWANAQGIIQTGWEKIDGAWYYFSTGGIMQTGWVKDAGIWYYLNEDGKMHTGWLEIGEDKYYLKASGAMATGTILIGEKAYKFGNNGKFISIEKEIAAKAQNIGSSTSWLILVDTTANKVGVFNGKKGNWNLVHYWSCSAGAPSTPTVKGYFTVGNRGTNFGEDKGYTCWWWTQFYGDYLFHSVLYYPYSKTAIQDGRLGMNLSHGCIRLHIDNAKWIYDNIPRGTKVYVY